MSEPNRGSSSGSARQNYFGGAIEASKRVFPHPRTFWSISVDAPNYHNVMADAPWFHPDSCRDSELNAAYARASRLPDGYPLSALKCWEWEIRFAVPNRALQRYAPESGNVRLAPRQMRARYVKALYSRFDHVYEEGLIPTTYGFDTWAYRTAG